MQFVRKLLLLFVFLFFGGVISLLYGQDTSWDLRNYHLYNAYAFLNNRYHYDIAPAQLQTYLNPLFDIPYYKLVMEVKDPIVVNFVMGFWYGLFAWASFKLICLIENEKNLSLITIGTALAISGVSTISQIGITSNDVATGSIVMCSILAACSALKNQHTLQIKILLLSFSGLICGLAVGFKLTNGVFNAGLFFSISVLVLLDRKQYPLSLLCFFSAASFLGYLISGGYWNYFLWVEFKNPFFPFLNSIFESPFYASSEIYASPFRVQTLGKIILLPFMVAIKNMEVSELSFSDPRLALGYLSFITIIVRLIYLRLNREFNLKKYRFHLFFSIIWIVSYVLWAMGYGIYRYMTIMETLSIILLLLSIQLFNINKTKKMIFIAIVIVLTLKQTSYLTWGRLINYGPLTLDITPPSIEKDSLVVILSGGSPLSYVIPFFGNDVRFVYPENNMLKSTNRDLLQIKAHNLINNWRGPIYGLAPNGYNFTNDAALNLFSLSVDYMTGHGCRPILSNIDNTPPQLCHLIRQQ